MTDKPDLDISIGTSLERLARQMAKVESQFRSTAIKQEKAFEASNKKIASQFDRLSKDANAALSKIRMPVGMGGFGAGLAGVLSTREIIQYADAWTVAGNKIAAASQIAGRQARSLSAINDIATETRSGLTETADLYAKLMRATAGVAKSEDEVARATEIVNKAFKAGGAAASEQSAGILQLGQALGSGVLQGDELRSLRENAPIVAQAIADEFGVSIAGLKELGAEGKLTSDRVFRAILNAQQPIEAAFSKTNATIGDSFQRLRNAVTEYIGDANRSVGATEKVASAMEMLAGNLDAVVAIGGVMVARFLGPATVAMLARLSASFLASAAAIRAAGGAAGVATGAMIGLRGALAIVGGPVGAVIAGLSLLPALTTSSAEKAGALKEAGDGTARALDAYAEASKKAGNEQSALGGKITATTQNMLSQSRAALQAARDAAELALKDVEQDAGGVGLFDRSEAARVRSLFQMYGKTTAGAANPVVGEMAKMVTAFERGERSLGSLSARMEQLVGAGREVGSAIAAYRDKVDIGLPGADEAREIVGLAEAIGGFDTELTKLSRARRGTSEVRDALNGLIVAMQRAADVGSLLRDNDYAETFRAQAKQAADAEGKVGFLNQALSATGQALSDLLASANPFQPIETGAAAAKAEVLSLKEAMEALPKEISSTISGLEGVSSGLEAATKLLHKFEGFRATPYDDGKRGADGERIGPTVWRAGWGSDTITLADGSIQKVTQGMRVSVEDANRDLERRLTTEFLPAARNAVGPSNFDALTPAQQGVLSSLSYNYGAGAWDKALKPVADAVKMGSTEMVGQAIYALRNHNGGINAPRRTMEGDQYVGAASVFANGVGFDGSIRRGEDREKELADKAKERADEAKRYAEIRKDLSESLASDLFSTQETAKFEKERAAAIQQINASDMSAPEKAAAIAEANGEYEKQVAILALLADAKKRGVDIDALVDASQQKTLGGLLGLKEGTITYKQAIDKLGEGYKAKAIAEQQSQAAAERLKQSQEFAAQQTQALKDGLVDAIVEGKNFEDVLGNVAKALAKAALQAALFGEGPMAQGGGGLLGGLFSGGGLLSGLFGGGGAVPGKYSSGGYTGAGGKYEPAGIVHRGEYVMDAATVRAAGGPAAMEAMRRGLRGYADGGAVGLPSIPTLPKLSPIEPQRTSAAPTISFAPTINVGGEVTQADIASIHAAMAKERAAFIGRVREANREIAVRTGGR